MERGASFMFLHPNQGVRLGNPSGEVRVGESESGSLNLGIQIREPESGNLNLGIRIRESEFGNLNLIHTGNRYM